MPNHITTIIVCPPEVAEALTHVYTDEEKAEMRQANEATAVRYKERTGNDWPYAAADETKLNERFVDFAMVIPTPPSEVYHNGGCSHQHPLFFTKSDPDWECWYSWNRQFWGTKWNAYETSIDGLPGDQARLQFDTAWSHPLPVIIALSEKFPDATLHVEWADEDLGSNQGEYEITDGVITDHSVQDGTEEALEHAAQLKYNQSYADLQAEWNNDDVPATPEATEEAQP